MTSRIVLMFGLAFGLVFALAPHARAAQKKAAGPVMLHGVVPPPPSTSAKKSAGSKSSKPFVPIAPAVAIKKANAYFNKTQTMIADFVQIGSDGRRAQGRLFIEKPGRMRFEYASPATLDIVADGTTVSVIDHKAGTMQQYFIWQTPLKFLVKKKIDLNHDVQVLNVTSTPSQVDILIKDKQAFGGPTKVKLIFDPKTFTLKQWQVTDPQGYQTLVSLFNQDYKTKPNPAVFQLYPSRSSNTSN